VGLALTAVLGRAGHSVVLVERYGGLYGLPRAIRFDGEAMRLFQTLGIVDQIEPEILASDSYVWYGADGEVILEIDSSAPAPSGWAASYSFWQPRLEAALERRVRDCASVTPRRGWAAEAIEQDGETVDVRLRRGRPTRREVGSHRRPRDGHGAVCRRGRRAELVGALRIARAERLAGGTQLDGSRPVGA
jgi:2-polyprenyl-6-methoxyphenol hydroxylase-like FAD-dependent oxidoreductase